MDQHRREDPVSSVVMSKDAIIGRGALDDELHSVAMDYLEDIYLYKHKLEDAVNHNIYMRNKTIKNIKRLRASLKQSKRSINNNIQNQKDIITEIANTRRRLMVISKTYKALITKRAKVRGFDNPTMKQAMSRFDWPQWKEAIDKEYQQLFDEGVFEECLSQDIPMGIPIIGSMMVLTVKRDPTKPGEIDKYKARLVALGNQQHESTYDNIKSGTARSASVKLLISIQAILGSHSIVMDVKGAYLKSKVQADKQLYMRLPDKRIVKLKSYLYGLKQAGYEWQQNITGCLMRLGYKRSLTDELVFSRWWDNGDYVIMCLHVDDFFVISSKVSILNRLHQQLVSEYGEVTHKDGDLLAYLGCKIYIDPTTNDITLSQPAYIEKIVDKFLSKDDLASKRQILTPMIFDDYKVKSGEEERVDQVEFLEMVGSLNYLGQYSRPEILFAVSVLAQRCSGPTMHDRKRAIRVFHYLRQSMDVGLTFKRSGEIKLICHADAAYNCYPDGRSHMGWHFSLGENNGSFFAQSKKTKLTVLSSTEAEYVTLCEATRDTVWLRRLLNEIGFPQDEATTIYQDNESTIKQVKGHRGFQATKHVNPKFHFTGEKWKQGIINIVHKDTKLMIADLLTKALHADDHVRLSNCLLGYNE
jgi:Reverse transcriptase (RNA-dependent DNA polymerase)